jgi:YVTN family beta-propeller protein
VRDDPHVAVRHDDGSEPLAGFVVGVRGRWDRWNRGVARPQPEVRQVTITPDGKHAYVTNSGDGTVPVITTATGAVSPPITVGNHPIRVAITPDGKHAYVANFADGTVSVITKATGAVSPPISVGNGSGGGGDHA